MISDYKSRISIESYETLSKKKKVEFSCLIISESRNNEVNEKV